MQTINNEPEMVVNKNSQWVDSVHGSGSKPRWINKINSNEIMLLKFRRLNFKF